MRIPFLLSLLTLAIVSFSQVNPLGVHLKRIEGNGNGGNVLDLLPNYQDTVLIKNIAYHPVYDFLKGPVRVEVYDTTLLPPSTFIIKLDSIANSSEWKIYRIGFTDTVFSDSTIGIGNLQLIPQWGMAVRVKQALNPGATGAINNGFLEATMDFVDPTKPWLTGLPDSDSLGYDNWIRSGSVAGGGGWCDDYGQDTNEVYEGVLNGTWAPYRLTACSYQNMGFDPSKYYTGPGFKANVMNQPQMKDVASVDVIFTADKSKWSRCVVFEMCEDTIYTTTISGISKKARKLDYRRAPSVDKNGNPAAIGSGASMNPNDANFISDVGMGWFPGYVINLETGERLNISFGENSALVNENGNDMLWNPTSTKYATYNVPWDTMGQPFGAPVFGGQHYLYIFGHQKDDTPNPNVTPYDTINVPRYDAGKKIMEHLVSSNGQPTDWQKREVYREAIWVNIPLLTPGQTLLSTGVKVRLRTVQSYDRGYSSAYYQNGLTQIYTDTTAFAKNRDFPMYEFDAANFGLFTPILDQEMTAASLFPNPFSSSAAFSFENKKGEVHQLMVFDIRGRMVQDHSNIKGSSLVLERKDLQPGVYFYVLSAGDKLKATGKFAVVGGE